METVVITGSTRGVGLGLAKEFLKRNRRVVISGRKQNVVDAAVEELSKTFDPENIFGCACNVVNFEEVRNLWVQSKKKFGTVDIWISNAGIVNSRGTTWDLDPSEIQSVIDVNLTGAMYCAKVAVGGMLTQGKGKYYNFEGFGSDGRQIQPGMTIYGATKSAIRYFTKALVKETKNTNIVVGAISPGIVVTDLLTEPYKDRPDEWKKAKKIFNILADKVDTVAPYLVDEVIANKKPGSVIAWLTPQKAFFRFISALFVKRQILPSS